MDNQKSIIESWHEEYDWQVLTNNFNEQKIIETIENRCDNASKRFMLLVCITNKMPSDKMNVDFCNKWAKHYREQQLKELLAGRNVALDVHEILDGINPESYGDFMFSFTERLQEELRVMYANQYQSHGGMLHVDHINNYGYISDILNHIESKEHGNQESV